MKRRIFLAQGALTSLALAGCSGGSDGGDTPTPPAPPPAPADRVTGWTQMPVSDYENIPPIGAGNFPFDPVFTAFDLSDATFMAQLGTPKFLPEIGDQRQLGSCTAWAVGYAGATSVIRASGVNLQAAISPEDLYVKILRRQAVGCGAGTPIHIGMDVLVQDGVTTLDYSPYSDQFCAAAQFNQLNTIDGYSRIAAGDVYSIRGSIQSLQPVSFGILVNDAFQRFTTPNSVFIPDGTGGGHALSIVGYDDNRQQFKIMNSWGAAWGGNGFFWIPYSSFAQYAQDVCIPFLRLDANNQLIAGASSNPTSPVVVQHMAARPYGAGVAGSYGVGVEMGWSAPMRLTAATISVLDPSQNVLFTKSFSVAQVARGLRFGGSIPDGEASYTYVRSTVTGTDAGSRQVTLTALTKPYQR